MPVNKKLKRLDFNPITGEFRLRNPERPIQAGFKTIFWHCSEDKANQFKAACGRMNFDSIQRAAQSFKFKKGGSYE
jgi:hypothetical protein